MPEIQLFSSHIWRAIFRALRAPVAYDIGANQGEFCQVAQEMGAYVVAFEPNPAHWACLRHLGVQLEPYALGPATRAQVLHVPGEHGYATLGEPINFRQWENVSVQVRPLDDYLGELYVPGLLKLDVEGAELGVLQGARRTLLRYHPPVICEYVEQNTRQFGYLPKEIDQYMYSLGYCWLDMPPWDRLYVAI